MRPCDAYRSTATIRLFFRHLPFGIDKMYTPIQIVSLHRLSITSPEKYTSEDIIIQVGSHANVHYTTPTKCVATFPYT